MGSNPINLALRFLLEMSALVAVGIWGWNQSEGWMKYVLAISLPLVFAAIWGVFAVVDDPSRSGSAPIVTPGAIRLVIELGFFAFATWSLYDLGWTKAAWILGITVLLHFVLSFDRVAWLLQQ